jgi:hypothetical protein
VRLGRFVVDDCVDSFDVETTGGEIGGEEEGDFAVTEGFDGSDTLELLLVDRPRRDGKEVHGMLTCS